MLYATLEAEAIADPGTTDDMPIELFCATDNSRGRRFWEQMGFTVVEEDNGYGYARYRR